MRTIATSLVVAFIAVAAHAATGYTITKTDARTTSRFTVLADGDRVRATSASRTEGPILYDSVIVTPGSTIALNSENETWYELEPQPFAPTAHYLTPLPKANVRDVRWTFDEAPTAAAGQHHYVGKLQYRVLAAQGIAVRCEGTFDVTTSDAAPRTLWPGRILPLLGNPSLDEKLTTSDAAVKTLPLRITLTATRQYEGGPAMTETVTIEATDLHATPIAANTFVRPATYRYQKPVIGAPGR